MPGPIREFLTADRDAVADMTEADVRVELLGWRAFEAEIPPEVLGWLARKYEQVRFVKRNYQGNTGVLLGVKFEAVQYEIGVEERGYDALRGVQLVERKTLYLPEGAALYFESIEEVNEYNPAQADEVLAGINLEGNEVFNNG